MRRHAMRDALEELRHPPARDLGVGAGDERRRIDEVDEQDGCELSFHGVSVRTTARQSKVLKNLLFKPKTVVQAAPLAS